jgi:DNA invertase Pin-like site-specific DNA recombinase
MTHVIYARRSSEAEERQALSIESQLDELRKFAALHGIEVAEELTEARLRGNQAVPYSTA